LQRDDVKTALATVYITPVGGAPAQFANQIRNDIERYGEVVKQANIKLE
jgi:tripartite-type tricarboxylate transporter receptor subunit TctC